MTQDTTTQVKTEVARRDALDEKVEKMKADCKKIGLEVERAVRSGGAYHLTVRRPWADRPMSVQVWYNQTWEEFFQRCGANDQQIVDLMAKLERANAPAPEHVDVWALAAQQAQRTETERHRFGRTVFTSSLDGPRSSNKKRKRQTPKAPQGISPDLVARAQAVVDGGIPMPTEEDMRRIQGRIGKLESQAYHARQGQSRKAVKTSKRRNKNKSY